MGPGLLASTSGQSPPSKGHPPGSTRQSLVSGTSIRYWEYGDSAHGTALCQPPRPRVLASGRKLASKGHRAAACVQPFTLIPQ